MVRVKADLGAGQSSVFVPSRVCVVSTTHVGFGESEVAGERNDGADVDGSTGAGSTAVPRLVIDAGVDAGQLRIINSDSADVNDSGVRPLGVRPRPVRSGDGATARRPGESLRGGGGWMRPDLVSIVSGAVVAALGAFVLLESTGALHVSLGWAAVVLSAAVGTILLLSGLLER